MDDYLHTGQGPKANLNVPKGPKSKPVTAAPSGGDAGDHLSIPSNTDPHSKNYLKITPGNDAKGYLTAAMKKKGGKKKGGRKGY